MVLNIIPSVESYMENENRDAVNMLAARCHAASLSAGWWTKNAEGEASLENPLLVPTKLCLIHSEISEAMEGHRKDQPDDKLPHRKMVEVELADAAARYADEVRAQYATELRDALKVRVLFIDVYPARYPAMLRTVVESAP